MLLFSISTMRLSNYGTDVGIFYTDDFPSIGSLKFGNLKVSTCLKCFHIAAISPLGSTFPLLARLKVHPNSSGTRKQTQKL